MAKFKFHLESVEKVRVQKEQQMLRELADVQRNYQEKILAKKDLLDKKKTAIESKNNLNEKVSKIEEIILAEDYIIGLKHNIVRADQAILRARRFLDQAMKNFILARRERMKIDRLKERALEEFKKEQAKKERRELDDLIVMRDRLKESNQEEETV